MPSLTAVPALTPLVRRAAPCGGYCFYPHLMVGMCHCGAHPQGTVHGCVCGGPVVMPGTTFTAFHTGPDIVGHRILSFSQGPTVRT